MEEMANGQFRVPVLLKTPASEAVREFALSSREGRNNNLDQLASGLPGLHSLDPDFEPIARPDDDNVPPFVETERLGESDSVLLSADVLVDDPADIPEEIDGSIVYANPPVGLFSPCLNDAPVGRFHDVLARLNIDALRQRDLEGEDVAIAIVDSGVNRAHLESKLGFMPSLDAHNSWAPSTTNTTPGEFRVGHGTMCAFAAFMVAPKATLIDCAAFARPTGNGPVSAALLSHALDGLQALWRSWIDFRPGSLRRYKALVCSNSWGVYHPRDDFPSGHGGRYVDNPDHPFHAFVHMLAGLGVDMIFAAGNCGRACPDPACRSRIDQTIMGANAHANVLTVAGCDIDGQIVGYSSHGPGISGMHAEKPDLVAYTHFLGSEAFGDGKADAGTSVAAPLAGGVVAALRSQFPSNELPPAALFQNLRSSAISPGHEGRWRPEHGYGILNPSGMLEAPRV